jgi:hypothetical protein
MSSKENIKQRGESMSLFNTNRMAMRIAAASVFCLAVSGMSAATAPNVSFTAAGTFGSTPVSGSDTLKLAGEPFTINLIVSAALPPSQHGPNWALFSPLKVTGQVHSGLLGTTPVSIASGAASIEQAYGPVFDLFEAGFPVKIVGINLTVLAIIHLPTGTIANQLIHPFASVPLNPTNATVSYSDGTNTTVLSVQSGSVVAAQVTAPTTAHANGLPQAGGHVNEAVLVQRRRANLV